MNLCFLFNINGTKVQRTLYSAFLIMNSNKDLKSTNKSLCDKTYNDFLIKHNELIESMETDDVKYPKSFGIKKELYKQL